MSHVCSVITFRTCTSCQDLRSSVQVWGVEVPWGSLPLCDADTGHFSALTVNYSISSCNMHVNQSPCVSLSQSGIIFVPKCPHVWWQKPFPGVSHVRFWLFQAELVVICLVWGSYLAYVPECLLSRVSESESCMKPWINTYRLCVIDV